MSLSRFVIFAIVASVMLAVSSAFSMRPSIATRATRMQIKAVLAPPGMKPDPNGGFKVAGAHPETFILENENGAKAIIDTHTVGAISWVTAKGVQLVNGQNSIIQTFPDAETPIKGGFVPEERAKKLSFDRMIYKLSPEGLPDIEYRVDVTLREASLEYDVIVMNKGAAPLDVSCGIKLNLNPAAKVSSVKGYTTTTDKAVSTGKWSVPVGKFKETKFYIKIDAPN